MIRIFSTVSLIALLAATPAPAQILGGGGGLGGGLGGLGGVTGSIGTSVSRTGTSATSTATGSIRAPRVPRAERPIKAPKPAVTTDATASVLQGRAAADAAASVNTATRQVSAAANVATATPRVALPAIAVPDVAVPAISVPAIAVPAIPVAAVQVPDVGLGYIGGADVVLGGRQKVLLDDGVVFIPRSQVIHYVDQQYEVLQRDLVGTGAIVERRGKQIFIELPSDVNFAFDRSNIQPRFYPVLNSVARTLNRFPATYVDVIGHTDAVGTDAYNQGLSERRASSVASYLVHSRANPNRLYVAGEGEREPVASNGSVHGRAANRRVEIVLTPHEGPA